MAGWGFNIFIWTIYIIPLVSCDSSHLRTVSSSVFSWYLLSTYSCGIRIISAIWSTQSGLFDVVSIIYGKARPNSRRLILWSGASDANRPLLWPKTLSRWAADHEARWAFPLTLRLPNHASLCWALSAARWSLSRWFLRLSLSLLRIPLVNRTYFFLAFKCS